MSVSIAFAACKNLFPWIQKMENYRPTEAELTGFNNEYKKTANGATHKSKIEVS